MDDPTDLDPSTLLGWYIERVRREEDGTLTLWLREPDDLAANERHERQVHLWGWREQGVAKVCIEDAA